MGVYEVKIEIAQVARQILLIQQRINGKQLYRSPRNPLCTAFRNFESEQIDDEYDCCEIHQNIYRHRHVFDQYFIRILPHPFTDNKEEVERFRTAQTPS